MPHVGSNSLLKTNIDFDKGVNRTCYQIRAYLPLTRVKNVALSDRRFHSSDLLKLGESDKLVDEWLFTTQSVQVWTQQLFI